MGSRLGSACLVAVCGLAWCPPARAGLVNDYSASDNVWGTPVATHHFLIDARAQLTTSSPLVLDAPTVSLAYGAGAGLEVGLWSAYTLTGIGAANAVAAPAPLNPYVKWQLPMSIDGTTFGLVGGAQIPMQAGEEHDAALEGVASVPLGQAFLVNAGLGIGRNLLQPATLYHGNLALYWNLPGGRNLLAEIDARLTGATPTYGQTLGLQIPLDNSLSGDIDVAAGEGPGGFAGFSPQIGLTFTS